MLSGGPCAKARAFDEHPYLIIAIMTRQRNTAQNEQRRHPAPKWTAAEEEVILDEIGKSPNNIKVALIAAAEKLPMRTYYGCANRWYSKMANRDDVVGRLTIGRTVTIRNKTRLKPEQETTHKTRHTNNIWNYIISVLFGGRYTND